MIEILVFISIFYICLISVLGYGFLLNKVCFNNEVDNNLVYIGFYGLALLTLISFLTSLIFAHNFLHNIIIHSIGIIFFLFLKKKIKHSYLKNIFYISFCIFSLLIISKTNDDFSYYHLPFTKYLTENFIIFGMGHLNHGYNLISSLFYLNSLFYLPYINFYSFHFTILYFLIFFNYFLLIEIFNNKNEISKYLFLFTFVFFNLSFNRLAEFGTDKVGQLLIVILLIKFFEFLSINEDHNKLKKTLNLLPLLAFCITLKTYFLPYILFSFCLIMLKTKFTIVLNYIIRSKAFIFFLIILILNFTHHFVHTGCFISPISFTCFDNYFAWSRDVNDIKNLSLWLEQWAKAGAGPNLRVDNPSIYISNFNWISNWFNNYFLGKFSDQLLLMITCFLIIFLFFKKFTLSNKKKFEKKNFYLFYVILLFIFFIWFSYHPTLRYGGYSIVFLILSFPSMILLLKFNEKPNFKKKFKILVILVAIILNLKNLNRINDEFERDDIYKFNNFPFYAIKNNEYSVTIFEDNLMIYSSKGHCWLTPSPCGSIKKNLSFNKDGRYKFIKIIK